MDGIILSLSKAIPALSDNERDQKSIETGVVTELHSVAWSTAAWSPIPVGPREITLMLAGVPKSLAFNLWGRVCGGVSRVMDLVL